MNDPIERIKGPVFELLDWMAGRTTLETVVISFFAVAVIIFVVFPIHECAHGFMAKLLGDDTADREGRLTLNPFAHIDPTGAIVMCFCCIGWAKPVPVTISRCSKVKGRTALALTSLAGPMANIILAYVFLIISKIVLMSVNSMAMLYVWSAIGLVVHLNIYLAVFNLLPIPPFDGSKILYSFLPTKGIVFMERYGQMIHWVFFALLIFGVLDVPLSFLTDCVVWVLDKASFFVG